MGISEIFDGILGYGKDLMGMENYIAFFEIYLQHSEVFDNDFDTYLQFVDECLQAYYKRFSPQEVLETPVPEEEEDGVVL